MKVCFIDPKGIHFGLNSGIGYIVSYIRQNIELDSIKVFDFNNKNDEIASRIEEIKRYDVIGVSIQSYTCQSALKIAHQIKTKNNILIAGGPHINIDGTHFMKTNEIFDIGVYGEGEERTASLLKSIEADRDFGAIKGIFYRKKNEIIFTGIPDRIYELDSLPYPDYSSFDSVKDSKIYNYPLVTSRGCPYRCIYCSVKKVIGEKWIARNVKNIIDELQAAKKKYRIDRFNIQDDNFTLDLNRAKCFCERLIECNFKIPWSCSNGIRADATDRELIRKMKKSGCSAISIGIESAVQQEFDAIKKGEKITDIIKTIREAQINSIAVRGNFIVGLPYSTLESIRTSIKFAMQLHLDSCIFNLLVPFPGTELWNWVQDNGQILRDWREGFTIGKEPKVIFETKEFPELERLKAYYESNTKCKNYFAFMNEHDPLITSIVSALKNIAKYDFYHLPGHFFWILKNFKSIISRIKEKIKNK